MNASRAPGGVGRGHPSLVAKEFLFYGSGCVEYCCTTSMTGSAVCNTA